MLCNTTSALPEPPVLRVVTRYVMSVLPTTEGSNSITYWASCAFWALLALVENVYLLATDAEQLAQLKGVVLAHAEDETVAPAP